MGTSQSTNHGDEADTSKAPHPNPAELEEIQTNTGMSMIDSEAKRKRRKREKKKRQRQKNSKAKDDPYDGNIDHEHTALDHASNTLPLQDIVAVGKAVSGTFPPVRAALSVLKELIGILNSIKEVNLEALSLRDYCMEMDVILKSFQESKYELQSQEFSVVEKAIQVFEGQVGETINVANTVIKEKSVGHLFDHRSASRTIQKARARLGMAFEEILLALGVEGENILQNMAHNFQGNQVAAAADVIAQLKPHLIKIEEMMEDFKQILLNHSVS